MSAATASSTETDIVFVRLLDEGTDVWRPVSAKRLSETTYKLSSAPVPEDEAWSFQPGDIVVAEHRMKDGAPSGELVAVARASDFDQRSQAAFSLAS
jgi:hypothetical protein